MLNSVIVLLVVTSVLGPILTERFAKQLPVPVAERVPDKKPADAVAAPAGAGPALA